DNVVLLCCNCHALFDGAQYPDVDLALMIALRDDAMRRPGFSEKVRDFVCQEMGTVRRRVVNESGLAPLFEWLSSAIERGPRPPPHRFVLAWGPTLWTVDLATESAEHDPEPDPSLPVWTRNGFVFPQAPAARR